jgi:hypothetical protein
MEITANSFLSEPRGEYQPLLDFESEILDEGKFAVAVFL